MGIFPNEAAVTRLTRAILLEIHDEWAVDTRRDLPLGSLNELDRLDDDGMTAEVGGASALLLASRIDADDPALSITTEPLESTPPTGHGPANGQHGTPHSRTMRS